MNKFWCLLVLLAGANTLIAQQLLLRDGDSGEPLPWATVEGIPSGRFVLTNDRGRADISSLDGDDSLKIRIVGYVSRTVPFDSPAKTEQIISLQSSAFSLDQLVVSSTRWEQNQESSASKVVTITPRQSALLNPQTTADLLASSGQVYVQKSQLGGGSPMIRGFSTNRLLLVIDGVRMNNAIFRTGNLQNVISLDALALEQTEILFGPGSVLYGSDAIGAVMSFQTMKPRFVSKDAGLQASGSVFARTASANWEKTGHADLRLSHSNWASVTSITFTDYDDQVMGKHGPDEFLRPYYVTSINGQDSLVANDDPRRQVESGYSQVNVMQKIAIPIGDSTRFDYGFHYSRSSDVPRYDRLRRPDGDGLRSAEWYYGPQLWMLHNLTLEADHHTALYDQLRVNLAFQQFGESRSTRDFGDEILSETTEGVGAFSFNLDLQRALPGPQRLFYGLEAVENFIDSKGTSLDVISGERNPAASRYPDGSRWSSYAVYANYHVEPGSKLSLEAGLRYNYIQVQADFDTTLFPLPFTSLKNHYGSFTGGLGAVFRPDEYWLLRVNTGTAFRAPNIDDVGKVFDSEPGAVVVPNADLRPEYAWNADLGLARTFGKTLRADFTGYYTWLQDALVRRDYTLAGMDSIIYVGELSQVQAIQNAANAYVYGFQAALELKLPKGFEAVARWNYQTGEEELDDGSTAPLRHAAPWFGSAELRWSGHNLRVSFIGTYQAEVSAEDMPPSESAEDYLNAQDENGQPYTPAWYRLDLKLLWQPKDYLQLSGGVENMTNQRYQPFSSGIVAAGLNGILGVKYLF